MSTKIYRAWRIEINKLNEFIDFVRPQVLEYSKNTVLELMSAVTEAGIEKQRKDHPYCNKDVELRLECVLDVYRYTSNQNKTGLNIDFSLNIWLYENHAYIIPVGDYFWFDVPKDTEEFRYWNNTDRPEELSEDEWNYRRSMWKKINCGEGIANHNSRRLNHSIIDMSGFGDVDFELMMHQEIKKRIE